MSITVNTNMQALKIQNNLNTATDKMNTAMERMSSGSKINSAADDAAGYAVSTKLSTTISSSKVASSNAQIGSNLLDSSEGSLNVILSNLQRVRDLTEQASTGTYSGTDKSALATEVNQRLKQVDSSSTSASFNGINLFGDTTLSSTGLDLQVGTDSTASSSLNLEASLFKSAMTSQLGLFQVNTTSKVVQSIQLGTKDGTAQTGNFLYKVNATDATKVDKITSVDEAINAIMSGTARTGADAVQTTVAGTAASTTKSFLDQVDFAITNVTNRVTKIGAYQNRLASVSDGLQVQQTNLTAAKSTIKDADVAEESASYVQQQILQSASASLLTQANSAPQIALTLIKG